MIAAQTSRPYVTLKLATSLDGRIAAANGESRWITGPEARAAVHAMRAAHDAVAVGIGTALADDPELTVRTNPAPERQPARVVIDTHCRLRLGSKLARSARDCRVVLYVTASAAADRRAALSGMGVDVRVTAERAGKVDLARALTDMKALNIHRVFVEGGGQLAAALIEADLVDRLEWMRAPIVLGAGGVPAIAVLRDARLSAAPRWRRTDARAIGDDLWESYET